MILKYLASPARCPCQTLPVPPSPCTNTSGRPSPVISWKMVVLWTVASMGDPPVVSSSSRFEPETGGFQAFGDPKSDQGLSRDSLVRSDFSQATGQRRFHGDDKVLSFHIKDHVFDGLGLMPVIA